MDKEPDLVGFPAATGGVGLAADAGVGARCAAAVDHLFVLEQRFDALALAMDLAGQAAVLQMALGDLSG